MNDDQLMRALQVGKDSFDDSGDELANTWIQNPRGGPRPPVSGEAPGNDPIMAALSVQDPENKTRSWSNLRIAQGPDDRPALADKGYMVRRMG